MYGTLDQINRKRVTAQTGMTSCGVVMWRTDGYSGADKETKGRQCQSNVTVWIVWNDGSEQKCEGTAQKERTSRGMVTGVLRMGVVACSGGHGI